MRGARRRTSCRRRCRSRSPPGSALGERAGERQPVRMDAARREQHDRVAGARAGRRGRAATSVRRRRRTRRRGRSSPGAITPASAGVSPPPHVAPDSSHASVQPRTRSVGALAVVEPRPTSPTAQYGGHDLRLRADDDHVVHDHRDRVARERVVVALARHARASRRRRGSSCRGPSITNARYASGSSQTYALSPRLAPTSVRPKRASAPAVRCGSALREQLGRIERAVVDPARRVRERRGLRAGRSPEPLLETPAAASPSRPADWAPNLAKNSPTPAASFFQSSFDTESELAHAWRRRRRCRLRSIALGVGSMPIGDSAAACPCRRSARAPSAARACSRRSPAR